MTETTKFGVNSELNLTGSPDQLPAFQPFCPFSNCIRSDRIPLATISENVIAPTSQETKSGKNIVEHKISPGDPNQLPALQPICPFGARIRDDKIPIAVNVVPRPPQVPESNKKEVKSKTSSEHLNQLPALQPIGSLVTSIYNDRTPIVNHTVSGNVVTPSPQVTKLGKNQEKSQSSSACSKTAQARILPYTAQVALQSSSQPMQSFIPNSSKAIETSANVNSSNHAKNRNQNPSTFSKNLLEKRARIGIDNQKKYVLI